MSAFTNAIESGLKGIETIMGDTTFVYDEEQYTCHVGTQTVSSVLESGGFNEKQQTVLVVRKSLFTDGIYPLENHKLTYKDIIYYIDVINTDATDTFFNISLKV